jgi:hypothetical protein
LTGRPWNRRLVSGGAIALLVLVAIAGCMPFSAAAEPAAAVLASAAPLDSPKAAVTRLPFTMSPSLGCWFWTAAEFEPHGYRPFLDLVGKHSAFTLLTASLRVPNREVTDLPVRKQIEAAAEYASHLGMRLVMDLDVRLARLAFQRAFPDELQEMLRLREVPLKEEGQVTISIQADVPSDHYTFAAIPYVPVWGRLVRVYKYSKAVDGTVDPESVIDITARCQVEEARTNLLRMSIPADASNAGQHATVMAGFTHLTPDLFAPHLMAFQRDILQQYRDVPLAGACKDEWGFPPCFDGSPNKDDYWFSQFYAAAYGEKTGGRDLVRDCLLMKQAERGRERDRQAAINAYQQLSWERNAALEQDFYSAVKQVFGSNALVATHPTWWPYPDAREFKKNGLHWWAAKRDLAQTDEVTPFAVRTALAKKWGSGCWVNMFYASSVAEYEQALWNHAMGGGRINYHPLYPTPGALALESTAALLRGDLMRGEATLRLLTLITQAPLNCPVAVIFGHAAAMNWVAPYYNDVGLGLTDKLWQQGYPADLIPSHEIGSGALKLDPEGWLVYGSQRYHAAIVYQPQFESAATASFLARAAQGKTALWLMGEWTRDAAARSLELNLPGEIQRSTGSAIAIAQVIDLLRSRSVRAQTPASALIGWDKKTAAPPRNGTIELTDGTTVLLSGRERVSGDPIHFDGVLSGRSVSAKASGLLAVRFGSDGKLAALAAGGLTHFNSGKVDITLANPVDLALWTDEHGQYRGLVQDLQGELPQALAAFSTNWLRIQSPPPVSSPP